MDSRPPPPRLAAAPSRGWAILAVLAVLAGSAVLFFFDPATHGFYPFCLFHRLTGLECPGCGGLRAVHQLTHGHLAAAWRLNALVVMALPVVSLVGGRWLWRKAAGRPGAARAVRPVWFWLLLAVLLAFGVLRNLSWPGLAPGR